MQILDKEKIVELDHNTPISNIPTSVELISSILNIVSHTEASGTNNTVYTFILKDNSKISVRIAIHSLFTVSKNMVRVSSLQNSSQDDATLIEELYQTRSNWINAARNNIAPKIYFYGYIKKETRPGSGVYELYPAMVSEGYDCDLSTYYNNKNYKGYHDKQKAALSVDDISIADQIVTMLDKSLTIDSLRVICFDIKPMNCVVNTYSDGRLPNVKLIDWDADWCNNYYRVLSKHGDTSPLLLISIFSKMLMAAHFYAYCKWNIFSDYFNTTRIDGLPILGTERKDSLRMIFCELADYSNYKLMVEHYFFNGQQQDCNFMFNKIYKWATKLKPNTLNSMGGSNHKLHNKSNLNKKKCKKSRKKTTKYGKFKMTQTKQNKNNKKNNQRKHSKKKLGKQ